MCNCVSKITKKASKKIVAEIEKNRPVAEWLNKGCFSNIGYAVTSDSSQKIAMPFVVEYRRQKTDGQPEKKITAKNVFIYPTYCPFCGEKFES